MPLLTRHGLSLERVDIALSDVLMAQYGVYIPVLKWADSESVLYWPFDQAVADQYLRHRIS